VTGDTDGDSINGGKDGDSINGGKDGDSLYDDGNLVDPPSLSHGVLGKHAKPSGHSELLPLGHGFRQLVDAS
jgi:hypothetical protein